MKTGRFLIKTQSKADDKEHTDALLVQGRESEEKMSAVLCSGFDKMTMISCSSPKREKLHLCVLLAVVLCL